MKNSSEKLADSNAQQTHRTDRPWFRLRRHGRAAPARYVQ